MLHEMLHLDLVADSYSTNPKIRDLKMKYKIGKENKKYEVKTEKVYDPELVKIMARYVPFSNAQKKTGYYTQRNDDCYTMFALAKYVTGKIGSYPFIPQVSFTAIFPFEDTRTGQACTSRSFFPFEKRYIVSCGGADGFTCYR